MDIIRKTLMKNEVLLNKKKSLQSGLESTVNKTQSIVMENARGVQNQDDYNTRYDALVEKYDKLKKEYDEVSSKILADNVRCGQIGRFISGLKEQDGVISKFNEDLWNSLVEKLVVKTKDDVTVVFKSGTEIKV